MHPSLYARRDDCEPRCLACNRCRVVCTWADEGLSVWSCPWCRARWIDWGPGDRERITDDEVWELFGKPPDAM